MPGPPGVSDVSKMLGKHQNQFSASSKSTAQSPGRTKNAPPQFTSANSASIDFSHHYPLLLMRCLESLKKFQTLTSKELRKKLSKEEQQYCDQQFLQVFSKHPRVKFDPEKRSFTYTSAYEYLNGSASIAAALRERSDLSHGLEITQEFLDFHKDAESWVTDLLTQKKLRAVRASRNVRCRNYATDSGLQCGLYDPSSERCEGCLSLKGVIIYTIENDRVENIKIDDDVKDLWAECKMPTMDDILEQYNRPRKRETVKDDKDSGKKKRRKPGGPISRSRPSRVYNTHIYSTEAFKHELEQHQQDEASIQHC